MRFDRTGKCEWRGLVWLLAIGCLAGSERVSGEPLAPASQRFGANGSALASGEVPSFQRHVSPVFGKLGCNGRACHGSFQGQGGFRLSLFGYDLKEDYKSLTGGETSRIDREFPEGSLVLEKADQVPRSCLWASA